METSESSSLPKSSRTDLLRFAFWAILIVLPIRLFIAQPFIVEGASMVPEFQTNNYLIIDELSYHLRDPLRGEVIVFKYPKDPKRYYIKRVIGLPGETVTGKDKNIIITNTEHPQGITLDESYLENQSFYSFSTTLGPNEYFVMGDNRPASSDSRSWGAVPRENMVGRALLRLYPFTEIAYLPGRITQQYATTTNK